MLYHGTSIDSAKSIVESGFLLSDICNSRGARDFEGQAVYGFKTFDDAQNFALDQGFDDHAVVAFDVDGDLIEDGEYDGGAYIAVDPKNERIIWTHDMGSETFYTKEGE